LRILLTLAACSKQKQDYRRETFVNSADSYNMYVIFSKYFEIYR
jgi:hypothetical protein